jgi:hypothetical protein
MNPAYSLLLAMFSFTLLLGIVLCPSNDDRSQLNIVDLKKEVRGGYRKLYPTKAKTETEIQKSSITLVN